jgi:hypothetical protein
LVDRTAPTQTSMGMKQHVLGADLEQGEELNSISFNSKPGRDILGNKTLLMLQHLWRSILNLILRPTQYCSNVPSPFSSMPRRDPFRATTACLDNLYQYTIRRRRHSSTGVYRNGSFVTHMPWGQSPNKIRYPKIILSAAIAPAIRYRLENLCHFASATN